MSEEENNISIYSENRLWRQIQWSTFVCTGISCWIRVTFRLKNKCKATIYH